jgi:hypothetical protein
MATPEPDDVADDAPTQEEQVPEFDGTNTDQLNSAYRMTVPKPDDVADDAPTQEEQVLEFDGANTDQLDSAYRMTVVSASENGSGSIDCDDRGRSRWKWVTESTTAGSAEKTFNYLRALTNDGLKLADDKARAERPEPGKQVGYDPYDTAGNDPPAQGASDKPKRS